MIRKLQKLVKKSINFFQAEQSHLAQIILPEQLLALNSQQPGVPQQSEDNQLVQVLTPEDLLTLQQNAAALQLMEELAPAELQQNKDNKFFFCK
jgi:hypothetical protein